MKTCICMQRMLVRRDGFSPPEPRGQVRVLFAQREQQQQQQCCDRKKAPTPSITLKRVMRERQGTGSESDFKVRARIDGSIDGICTPGWIDNYTPAEIEMGLCKCLARFCGETQMQILVIYMSAWYPQCLVFKALTAYFPRSQKGNGAQHQEGGKVSRMERKRQMQKSARSQSEP